MKRLTIVATGVLFAISGCQSTQQAPREIQTNKQEQKEVSAFDAYEQSKSNYEKWLLTLKKAKDLQIYSPGLYDDLLSSWDKAVEIYDVIAVDPAKAKESYSFFSSATYSDEFAKRLSEVVEQHSSIMKIKEQADLILSDARSQMHYLEQINAVSFLADNYHTLEHDYRKLFEYVEDNEIAQAKSEQVLFLSNAKALEVKVVLAKYIAPLEKELRNFARTGFNKLAAVSYAKAKVEISSAKNVVTANTRNLQVIKQAVSTAEFELAHVHNVGNEVKQLAAVTGDKFEPIVLEYERKLLSVSKALNGADYRDLPMHEQTELIVAAVKKLHEDKSTDELETQVASLTAEIEQLKLSKSSQAQLLVETKNKSELLAKQLERSELRTENLQTLLNAYQQPLATEIAGAQTEQAAVKPEQPTAVEIQKQTTANIKEPAVVAPAEPAAVEAKETVVVAPAELAVVDTKEMVVVEPVEAAVVDTKEMVVVEPAEAAVVETKEKPLSLNPQSRQQWKRLRRRLLLNPQRRQ